MLTLSYLECVLVTLAQALLYVSLGMALSRWWHKPAPDPWARSSREWEDQRYGSSIDGSLSRIRWLPVNHEGEED